MPKALVECIPNFSEARRMEVVDAIVSSIQSVKGVKVLDRHSDMDHNRTVITLVGDPAAVEEAAFQSIKTAAGLINMEEHTGAHPRIGATDVVPFVPISGISMADCIAMAERLGRRVGAELTIPVYLYEEAAKRPDRENLENIRKGQYEGLKVEIIDNPERKPDFGPADLGSAGATVIGARAPLIAFNMYLNTDDLSIAKKIAKAVRHSSGGFRFIKAMGVMVDGLAQVSMNMTNFRQTPMARVVEAVRREAQRYGADIHHSELVGLIPQDALIDAAVWYTQLECFKTDQVLENRLMKDDDSDKVEAVNFLEDLASGNPTPGGGSAAAFTAASAAALVAMVGRLTAGKKKYAEVEDLMSQMISEADSKRQELLRLVEEDAASFESILKAARLPKETNEQQTARQTAMEAATYYAAQVPFKTVEVCIEVMKLAVTAAKYGNLNAISDALSAVHLSCAALKCAAANVRVNVQSLINPIPAQDMLKSIEDMINIAEEYELDTLKVFSQRSGVK